MLEYRLAGRRGEELRSEAERDRLAARSRSAGWRRSRPVPAAVGWRWRAARAAHRGRGGWSPTGGNPLLRRTG